MRRFTIATCLMLLAATAEAGQAGCKFYKWQFAQQAEAELSQLFAAGATIVDFRVDNSSMPYQALVCQR